MEGNVTSILDSCTVQGSVFGAGYSASRPTVAVDSLGFRMEPYYYEDLGTYRNGVKGVTTPYTWEHRNTVDKTSNAIDKTNHILYTTEDLSETNLGSVEGNAILTLQGTPWQCLWWGQQGGCQWQFSGAYPGPGNPE